MATTGSFSYGNPATIVDSDVAFVKPWSKVDTDVTSFDRIALTRPVANVRELDPDSIGVNTSGFALYHSPSRETQFTDEAAIRNGYYTETESLLRAKLSTPAEPVRKVVIFDHTIRRRGPHNPRQPVQQVHVDQTPKAAEVRVRRHASTDAAELEVLLKGRYQIVNVWRPIGHNATDHPLAFIDYRTTEPKDLVHVDLLYPNRPARADGDGDDDDDDDDDRGKEVLPDPTKIRSTDGYTVKGETFTVIPNDKHRFFYVKDMTPDEVLFIKCFDSRSEVHPNGRPGVAAYTPHTAFDDPATPAGTPGRQSIEIRALVFYEETQ